LLETLRYVNKLNKDGIGVINNYKARIENYPDDIIDKIKKNNVILIDWQKISSNTKVINLFFLGILSRYLGIEEKFWIESIKEIIPKKYVDINLRVFEEGQIFVSKIKKDKLSIQNIS